MLKKQKQVESAIGVKARHFLCVTCVECQKTDERKIYCFNSSLLQRPKWKTFQMFSKTGGGKEKNHQSPKRTSVGRFQYPICTTKLQSKTCIKTGIIHSINSAGKGNGECEANAQNIILANERINAKCLPIAHFRSQWYYCWMSIMTKCNRKKPKGFRKFQ